MDELLGRQWRQTIRSPASCFEYPRFVWSRPAIGDVVNTAARLQAAAASGEIVMSSRVHDRAGGHGGGTEMRELELKGKSRPEVAIVSRFEP